MANLNNFSQHESRVVQRVDHKTYEIFYWKYSFKGAPALGKIKDNCSSEKLNKTGVNLIPWSLEFLFDERLFNWYTQWFVYLFLFGFGTSLEQSVGQAAGLCGKSIP